MDQFERHAFIGRGGARTDEVEVIHHSILSIHPKKMPLHFGTEVCGQAMWRAKADATIDDCPRHHGMTLLTAPLTKQVLVSPSHSAASRREHTSFHNTSIVLFL